MVVPIACICLIGLGFCLFVLPSKLSHVPPPGNRTCSPHRRKFLSHHEPFLSGSVIDLRVRTAQHRPIRVLQYMDRGEDQYMDHGEGDCPSVGVVKTGRM